VKNIIRIATAKKGVSRIIHISSVKLGIRTSVKTKGDKNIRKEISQIAPFLYKATEILNII